MLYLREQDGCRYLQGETGTVLFSPLRQTSTNPCARIPGFYHLHVLSPCTGPSVTICPSASLLHQAPVQKQPCSHFNLWTFILPPDLDTRQWPGADYSPGIAFQLQKKRKGASTQNWVHCWDGKWHLLLFLIILLCYSEQGLLQREEPDPSPHTGTTTGTKSEQEETILSSSLPNYSGTPRNQELKKGRKAPIVKQKCVMFHLLI